MNTLGGEIVKQLAKTLLFTLGLLAVGCNRVLDATVSVPSPEPLPTQSGSSEALPANAKSPLGTNLEATVDYTSEYSLVDAFKMSRQWISGNATTWDDSRAIDVDANGWVRSLLSGQIARTAMFSDGSLKHAAGRYTVLYEGDGTLAYSGCATKVGGAPGRDEIEVDPSRGAFLLYLTATNPANYLRNIRVIVPGGSCSQDQTLYCESNATCGGSQRCVPFSENYAQQIFHPTFLTTIKPYRLIRFMDWMRVNGIEIVSLDERPKVEDARWSIKGVPLEILVNLANRMKADAWFNIPHKASDSLIEGYATIVHRDLQPGLKAYVEYSNEVWNGFFPQHSYAADRGIALGLSTDRFEATLRYFSKRSVEIFDIWSRVMGGKDRLVRVMASMAVSAWVSETELRFQNAYLKTDALAVAPYFYHGKLHAPGNYTNAEIQAMTPEQVISEIRSTYLPEAIGYLKQQKQLVDSLPVNIDLIAYEGGQHLAGFGGMENNTDLTSLFLRTNRHPQIGELYDEYLKAWKDAGGKLFVNFHNCGLWSKWGAWGAMEYTFQDPKESPKYQALLRFIQENPIWW